MLGEWKSGNEKVLEDESVGGENEGVGGDKNLKELGSFTSANFTLFFKFTANVTSFSTF